PTDNQQTPTQRSEQAVQQDGTKGTSTSTASDSDSGEGFNKYFSGKKEAPKVEAPIKEVQENLVATEDRAVTVETDLFVATFMNKGAGLKSFVLKKYNNDKKKPLDLISNKARKSGFYPFYFTPFETQGVLAQLKAVNNKKFVYEGNYDIKIGGSTAKKELVFRYADMESKVSVVKKFIISSDSYVIGFDCQVFFDGRAIEAPIIFGPDLEKEPGIKRALEAPLQITVFKGDDTENTEFGEVDTEPNKNNAALETGMGVVGSNYEWAAFESTYFAVVFKTHGNVSYSVLKKTVKLTDAEKEKGLKEEQLYAFIVVTNAESFFIGPKDEAVLESVAERYQYKELNKIIVYGWPIFDVVAKLLHKGIVFVYQYIPNYGWALVILTILVKILLFPLTYTSSVSMAKMQTPQPKIKAMSKKNKNLKGPEQRRNMNMETMQLYKTEKVNPAGGCLPMLLQMPILFAFFRLLPFSITFRHEPWIAWITDLSLLDPYYVLPILMGASQIITTK
ncbi:MAG: membrane protein insertase YidC, partial [bacterium]|nr:membrane protein insertase YidC [bacterium]